MTTCIACRAFSWIGSLLAIPAAIAGLSAGARALDIERAVSSSPITILTQEELAAVVNPRVDTLSILRTDTGAVIATLPVGDEPRSVAVDRNRTTIFVANAAGSSVSMIPILNSTVANFATGPAETLLTGAEPWDVVVSPDSKRAFVSNSAQGTISVINAIDRTLIGQIDVQNSLCNDPDRSRRFQPRGLAINATSDRLLVTRFLSFTRSIGGSQGSDIGKEGAVCAFNINTSSTSIADYKPFALITLPMAFSGFDVDRTGDGVADPTFAFPNQLQNIVLRGNRAFLPSIGASPEGPLFHRTSIQSLISVFDNAATGTPFGAFSFNINQHAVQPEAGKRKLFFTNPAAMAFTTQSGAGQALVLSAGSDLLVKFNIDAANNMAPTVNWDTTRYIDLNDPSKAATSGAKAGFAPHGLAVLGDGSRAFIANQWSGNVSIVDLRPTRW